jgi:hypothetical protein
MVVAEIELGKIPVQMLLGAVDISRAVFEEIPHASTLENVLKDERVDV